MQLNQPPVLGTYVPQEEPLCLMDAPNIVVDTIKPADTAEHALLVRVYEAAGMQTQTFMRLHPSVNRVLETDMLEQNARELEMARPVSFGAFEIKTLLLYV